MTLALAKPLLHKHIPEPPPRPAELSANPEAAPSGAVEACLSRQASLFRGISAPVPSTNPACEVAEPILLQAVLLSGGGSVTLLRPAQVSCSFATVFAHWIRDDVASLFATGGVTLAQIEIAGAYECRGRNRVPGAKISEHGTGNAIDISALVTSQGERFDIAKTTSAPQFFKAVKSSACIRFSTVLGPGSDPYHSTHLHVDLQVRSSATHFCQWKID